MLGTRSSPKPRQHRVPATSLDFSPLCLLHLLSFTGGGSCGYPLRGRTCDPQHLGRCFRFVTDSVWCRAEVFDRIVPVHHVILVPESERDSPRNHNEKLLRVSV